MTPSELAEELGLDPKRLRQWLRKMWPPLHPHSRWDLTPAQVDAARNRFGRATTPLPTPSPRAAPLVAPTSTIPSPDVAVNDDQWSAWTPLLAALETAPKEPGVYMARQGVEGPVVYVGMAGERRGQGIRGRLAIYVSGKGLASGLGEALFDRALADINWLEERLAEVKIGQPIRAKLWGRAALARADLEVRWQETEDRAGALALEMTVMRALPQEPLWNRLR